MIKTSKIRDEIFFDDCFLKIKEVSSTMRSQVRLIPSKLFDLDVFDLTHIQAGLVNEINPRNSTYDEISSHSR